MANVSADMETIKSKFTGKWKLTKSEGLDDYLKSIDINFMARKMAATASVTLEVSVDGNTIRVVTNGPKNSTEECQLNQEADKKDPSGNDITAVVTFENGKMVTKTRPRNNSKAKEATVTREIIPGTGGKPDEMIMTVNNGVAEMTRYFAKQS
ncbi:fatty acid-binding protein, heart-like [Argopecten irradians]|uniref:fatty acid-binding protein, heart-like n=1 Tax=Argopecten irradians TaxID=31199 RepID=UPI003712983B